MLCSVLKMLSMSCLCPLVQNSPFLSGCVISDGGKCPTMYICCDKCSARLSLSSTEVMPSRLKRVLFSTAMLMEGWWCNDNDGNKHVPREGREKNKR